MFRRNNGPLKAAMDYVKIEVCWGSLSWVPPRGRSPSAEDEGAGATEASLSSGKAARLVEMLEV